MAASKKENMNAGRVEYLGDDREGKLAALNNAVAAIEKNYGKGSIMKLGDSSANIDIEAIPTGSISLDVALGVGGVPRGRIIEIYGPESSGKTTVALHMIAEAQKRNGIAGFIDAEHALDPQYAKKIGVDIDNLYISQPDNGEQALEIAETMIRSGALDIVIVDSVAALVPKAEIEGDMDDHGPAGQAVWLPGGSGGCGDRREPDRGILQLSGRGLRYRGRRTAGAVWKAAGGGDLHRDPGAGGPGHRIHRQ